MDLDLPMMMRHLPALLRDRPDLFRLRREAATRARRARRLIVQDWERWLAMPRDDARKELLLYPAPCYEPLR